MTAREIVAELGILTASTREMLGLVEDYQAAGVLPASLAGRLIGLMQGLRAQGATLRAALGATDYGQESIPADGPAVSDAWRWQGQALTGLLRLEGALRRADALLAALAVPATREVIVRTGDTLQGVAARELGDVRRWPELALLNHLAPGALSAGVLLVPVR